MVLTTLTYHGFPRLAFFNIAIVISNRVYIHLLCHSILLWSVYYCKLSLVTFFVEKHYQIHHWHNLLYYLFLNTWSFFFNSSSTYALKVLKIACTFIRYTLHLHDKSYMNTTKYLSPYMNIIGACQIS